MTEKQLGAIYKFMGGNETIRCVRLWTGSDQNSHFEEGWIAFKLGSREDLVSGEIPVVKASFQETVSGGSFAWHNAPARQLVVTLSGVLDFQTRGGEHCRISPGDILLAEDTSGSGHCWQLIGKDPWRRLYVVLARDTIVPFTPGERS